MTEAADGRPVIRRSDWIEIVIVRDESDPDRESVLAEALKQALRGFQLAIRRIGRGAIPEGLPLLVLDLDWCAEDDLLVGDVRRRFGQVPMIAMIDRPWPDLVERLVTAGIGECLSAAELGQRIGERILVHLVATAERDRAIETWRRRANEAERRFAETIERSSDGMLIIDAAGMVRYANRAAQVMLGRKATALVGFDFGNPLAMVVAELDLVRGDGEPIIVELRVTEIVWNEAPARLAAAPPAAVRPRRSTNRCARPAPCSIPWSTG